MTDVIRLSLQMGGQLLSIPLMDGSQVNLPGDVDVFPRDTGLDVAIQRAEDRRHFRDVVTEKGVGLDHRHLSDRVNARIDRTFGTRPDTQSIVGCDTPSNRA